MSDVVERLLCSDEPCIRYRALVDVCGVAPTSPEARREQEAIRSSDRAKSLLSHRDADGRIPGPVYAYNGAHWTLVDWGPICYRHFRNKVMSPFVTLDALYVLRAAGRLSTDAN